MREIKFRCWDSPRQKMVTPSNNDTMDWLQENKHWKIMQYTGLKDKNGKEIYEGDILRYYLGTITDKDGTRPSHIDFSFEWTDYQGSGEYDTNIVLGYSFENAPEDCEIVGNIYENPDLLTHHQ